MRLYLPEGWLADPKRLDKAKVPEAERRSLTKGQIALELLDRIRAEGLPGGLVVADSGYGVSGPFRDGLAERGLHYVVGVTDEMLVFTEEPRWDEPKAGTGGRPQKRRRLAEGSPRPVGLKELAARTPRRKVTWREGTKGPMWGRFAWLRVWPGQGWATGDCAGAEPIWLLIEEQADGKLKYAFSNLPADTSRIRAVRLWRSRWPVELGYQQMKEELGLDHHEGRSWRGFHHHACLVMLAFGFLTLERRRARRGRSRPGKKGRPSAGDHGAGDPPGVAAAAGAGQPAGLRALPALAHPLQDQANGVVLEALTKPCGMEFAPWCCFPPNRRRHHHGERPHAGRVLRSGCPPPAAGTGHRPLRRASRRSGTGSPCVSSGSSWPPAIAGRMSRRNSAAQVAPPIAGCGPGRRPASGTASMPTC
ncbi:Transposase DDE domain protein (plasmid) [Tautonia plasticadhaerens]|uniref:Transposase DDE domain protein n=1 Tax=Tautonia plasticadhaerens TaxID=2527974 RepID=A0A518HFC4_9BACT|nr:Transposase DDE domain protein [Tautonia plasticadhaerens]